MKQIPETAKQAAVYALKSAVLLTHVESVRKNISRSIRNIKKLNGDESFEAALGDNFAFDRKGRLIPKDYSQIIEYQAYKSATYDFLELIAKSGMTESDLDKDEVKAEYLQKANALLSKYQAEITEKASKAGKLYRRVATFSSLAGVFVLVSAFVWLVTGHPLAILSIPSGVLFIVAGLRFAVKAAVHNDRQLYTMKAFFERYGKVGWIFG